MTILKRINIYFNKMLLIATSLVVIGAFLLGQPKGAVIPTGVGIGTASLSSSKKEQSIVNGLWSTDMLRPVARMERKVASAETVVKAQEIHGLSATNIIVFYTFGYGVIEKLPIKISYSFIGNNGIPEEEKFPFNIDGLGHNYSRFHKGARIMIYAESNIVAMEILNEIAMHLAYVFSTYDEVNRVANQEINAVLITKASEFRAKLKSMALDLDTYSLYPNTFDQKAAGLVEVSPVSYGTGFPQADRAPLESILRPRAMAERQAFLTDIPPASLGVAKNKLLLSIGAWLDGNGAARNFGYLPVLIQEGYIHFEARPTKDGQKLEIGVYIIPQGGERTLAPNGAYADGGDCFEGAHQLLRELQAKGYTARLRYGQVGIWNSHVYVELFYEDGWIPISTTPDMPHFNFMIAEPNPEIVSDTEIEENFKELQKKVLISVELHPMEFFSAQSGLKVLITGIVDWEILEDESEAFLQCKIYCVSFIINGHNGRILRIDHPKIGMPSDGLRKLQNKAATKAFIDSLFPKSAEPILQLVNDRAALITYEMLKRIDPKSAVSVQERLIQMEHDHQRLEQLKSYDIPRAIEDAI